MGDGLLLLATGSHPLVIEGIVGVVVEAVAGLLLTAIGRLLWLVELLLLGGGVKRVVLARSLSWEQTLVRGLVHRPE